jgi:hypothetical protein
MFIPQVNIFFFVNIVVKGFWDHAEWNSAAFVNVNIFTDGLVTGYCSNPGY